MFIGSGWLFNHFSTHPLVSGVENLFAGQIEGSLEDENTRHDADGVGGSSLEDQIVQSFHFRVVLRNFSSGKIFNCGILRLIVSRPLRFWKKFASFRNIDALKLIGTQSKFLF